MKLLGLDLANRSGYAFGERTGRPHFGTVDLSGFTPDQVLAKSMGGIYGTVYALVKANGIEGVAIEEPQRGIMRRNERGVLIPTSAQGERALTMLAGAAAAGAHNGGAKTVWFVAPKTWRKAVLGNGLPKNPKQAARDYCRMVHKMDVQDDNAAEAICILQHAWGLAFNRALL